MMYQIEVITTSEDEETRIVRFNPKVLQQALDESFENKIKVKTCIITEMGYRKVKVAFTPHNNYELLHLVITVNILIKFLCLPPHMEV